MPSAARGPSAPTADRSAREAALGARGACGAIRKNPEFSCSDAREQLFYIESNEQVDGYIDALRHAGARGQA